MIQRPYCLGIMVLVVLLLALPILVACNGDDEQEKPIDEPTPTSEQTEKVTITIGNVTDLSGPAATSAAPVIVAMEDVIRYYNEENLIPGVEFKLINYDTIMNAGKFIPGYEWLKEEGADVFACLSGQMAEVIKNRVEQDGHVAFTASVTMAMIDPPGRVFSSATTQSELIQTLLKWIAENDWDYTSNGPAKIGMAAWEGETAVEIANAMESYAEAYPDQFMFTGGNIAPLGTPTWGPEVEALCDCDYVFPPRVGFAIPRFMTEYRNAGCEANFIGIDSHLAFLPTLIKGAGWNTMDGMLIAMPSRWHNEDGEIVDLANRFLNEYHDPGMAEELIASGTSYLGTLQHWYIILGIIDETVRNVGPENFSGDALYQTATNTSIMIGGNQWTWTDTKRTSYDYLGIYEAIAAQEDIFRKDPEWQPVVSVS